MYELVLPFIGEVNLMPYVIVGIVLLFVWDNIPSIIGWAVKAIKAAVVSLVFKTKEAIVTPDAPKPEASVETKPVAPIETNSLETSLKSLVELTVWAVKKSGPEVLAKVTALFHDLQKEIGAK